MNFSGVLGVAQRYMIVNICIHFVYLVIDVSLVPYLNFNLFKGKMPDLSGLWVSFLADSMTGARSIRND